MHIKWIDSYYRRKLTYIEEKVNMARIQRILIIGSTGFLGTHLIKKLAKTNIDFVCTTSKMTKINMLKSYCPRVLYCDITDKNSILNVLNDIDIVINLAAITQSNDKKLNYKVNVLGIKNLVEACKIMKIKKLISISSVDAILRQKDCYGETKLQGQKIIENSGLDYIIFIPTVIYGIGDRALSKTISFIKKLPITPIFGSGKIKMQPVYVGDVCDAIISAIEKPELKRQIYNIAGSQVLSFESYVRLIEDVIGNKKPHIHIPLFLIKPIVRIFETVMKKPPISTTQLYTLTQDNDMDISKTVKDLAFKPIPFSIGINMLYEDKK